MINLIKQIFCFSLLGLIMYGVMSLIKMGGPWFLAGFFFAMALCIIAHKMEYGFWPWQKQKIFPPDH